MSLTLDPDLIIILYLLKFKKQQTKFEYQACLLLIHIYRINFID
jgi:hypothetical protein